MKRTPIYLLGKSVGLAFFKLFMPYKIHHREHMPQTGPVIICCNHLTFKDPVLLTAVAAKRQIRFMAKVELFHNKLVAFFMRGAGVFAVHRGKGDTSAINTANLLLQQGQVVGMFIEGTRSKDGNFLQPKAGVAMLAHSNHVPILPVCITGRKRIFPKLFHQVDIVCGPLIQPEQLGIEKGSGSEYRLASRLVMSKIAELRNPALMPKALEGEESC